MGSHIASAFFDWPLFSAGMLRKPQVKATLPEHVVNDMDKHAKALGVTRGEYLALIAKKWFADGSPAISEEETRVRDRHIARRAS